MDYTSDEKMDAVALTRAVLRDDNVAAELLLKAADPRTLALGGCSLAAAALTLLEERTGLVADQVLASLTRQALDASHGR